MNGQSFTCQHYTCGVVRDATTGALFALNPETEFFSISSGKDSNGNWAVYVSAKFYENAELSVDGQTEPVSCVSDEFLVLQLDQNMRLKRVINLHKSLKVENIKVLENGNFVALLNSKKATAAQSIDINGNPAGQIPAASLTQNGNVCISFFVSFF